MKRREGNLHINQVSGWDVLNRITFHEMYKCIEHGCANHATEVEMSVPHPLL